MKEPSYTGRQCRGRLLHPALEYVTHETVWVEDAEKSRKTMMMEEES